MTYPQMVQPLLTTIGLNKKEIKVRFEKGAIEHYITLDEIPDSLKEFADYGDEIVFFTSRKPTAEKFKKDTSKYLKGQYYENDKFIAIVGNPK